MRLILVGNYPPDAQQSMLRFGALLRERWTARGVQADLVAPGCGAITQALRSAARGGTAKWLGYVDKYLLFPPRLTRAVASLAPADRPVVHIVDHSNAVYVPKGRRTLPWVVTCHDLLAVRGALGEDTDCPASALGRRLQRSIVRGLGRASAIVADSTSTLQDVRRLVPAPATQLRRVAFLGLSYPYRVIDGAEAQRRLDEMREVPWSRPYVLHVGSNLRRKNKSGVLRVFIRLAPTWPGNLVFCGAPLAPEIQAEARAAGVASRVFAVPAPDNAQLEAIYNRAHALLFPSKCEGFGWPVIEAQACGCPVVCSDRTSLPEIGSDAALVHAMEDERGMAASVERLADPTFRAGVVARGFANLRRFAVDGMIDAYGQVYEEVLATAAPR